jgi:hypothetical protein
MSERSSVAQVSQIGLEGTPGTAVAATRRLGSLSITPSMQIEAEPFRPEGLKFPTLMVLNREWTEVDVEGTPTYEEVIIPLSGAVDTATVSEVLDGATPTGAFEWAFTPASAEADDPKTFTLERGQEGVQSERFAHVLFTSFGIEVSRSEVSLSCSGLAKAAEKDAVFTPGLETPTDLNPITPGQFSVYMADTQAALSVAGASDPTKRLGRVISTSPSIEDRYNPAWFVNSAEASFTTWVENPDGAGGGWPLTVEADAAGMDHLDTLRAGTTKFVRLEALGPVIYNAGTQLNLRHMFRWDMAVKVQGADAWGDEDGIYAIPWSFSPMHDATWGQAQQITVRNMVAAL